MESLKRAQDFPKNHLRVSGKRDPEKHQKQSQTQRNTSVSLNAPNHGNNIKNNICSTKKHETWSPKENVPPAALDPKTPEHLTSIAKRPLGLCSAACCQIQRSGTFDVDNSQRESPPPIAKNRGRRCVAVGVFGKFVSH